MEKQTKITKTCEKKSIVWLSSSWLKCKIIDTPFLMLDNNVAYHDVRSSLPPNNIDASGDKNNISWTKTTNSNQRHALSLSGINARWLFPLMDGASEWTLHQILVRMTNRPTSSLWRWGCGDERTETSMPDCRKQRRSSEAFHGRGWCLRGAVTDATVAGIAVFHFVNQEDASPRV